MQDIRSHKLAVWAVTPKGAALADTLAKKLPESDLFLSETLGSCPAGARQFSRLSDVVPDVFGAYRGHVFIMAAGIVVRVMAPLIRHKTIDPAVVVMDELGRHAVSLLSGHIGGANRLADRVAAAVGAEAVITTATDLNGLPAIDVLARKKHLVIENPDAVKFVNAAFLKGRPVGCYDPFDMICAHIPGVRAAGSVREFIRFFSKPDADASDRMAGVFIDDICTGLPPDILVLRPRSLAAGIGCNRNTPMEEIEALLVQTLHRFQLSSAGLSCIASIDLKSDEAGLVRLARKHDLPFVTYAREDLGSVQSIQNPSDIVEKHVGVKSVCEAAAILSAQNGTLIVPKQSTRNVTVAIARKRSIS